MKLSEKPFEELKVGDVVISALGNPGKIIALISEGQPSKYSLHERYDSVTIQWDHRDLESHGFHMNSDCIELVN